jgi:fatty-acyl-CoA synthase
MDSQAPLLSVWDGRDFVGYSRDRWRAEAERAAAGLRELGVERGSQVACVLTNRFPAAAAAIGVWLAGGTIVSLPTMARGMSVEGYLRQLRGICETVGAELLLLEQAHVELLEQADRPPARLAAYESLPLDKPIAADPPQGEDIAFVQFSSGSTSAPRGARLSMRAIETQLEMMVDGLGLDPPREQGVTWLPLSHDLGFFGGLMLCYFHRMPLLMSTPERFLKTPRTWFGDCHDVGATITAGPNFALGLATRAAELDPPGPFPMRNCVLGGERIEASTLRAATAALGGSGLVDVALMPAYGLAEAVLAVTMKPLGEAPRNLRIERDALAGLDLEIVSRSSNGRHDVELVGCGKPLRGASLRIDGPGAIGEVMVSSPSLAEGYIGGDGGGSRFGDELATGDIGFLDGGQLYVVGRRDDMIAVGGRKVWARDVETALDSVPGIRRGNHALVDVDGNGDRPHLVVLLEPGRDVDALTDLAHAAAATATEASGVRVDEVIVVPHGAIPKTPSGKLSRFRCREIARDPDTVEPLARIGA